MSLLMDVLRKFQFQKKRSPVHPALLKRKERKGGRVAPLVIGGLFLASAGIAYFITDLLASKVGPVPADVRVAKREMLVSAPKQEEPKEVPEPKSLTEETPKEEPRLKEDVEKPKVARLKPEEEIRKITEDLPQEVEENPPVKTQVRVVSPLEDTTTYLILADRYFREGDLEKSREYYEKAYSVLRTEEVANNLLVVCMRMGDQDCVRRVLVENSSEKVVYTYLIELSKAGFEEEAIKDAKRYTHIDRKGYIYFALGYAYETLGDYSRALENYRRAYRKNPHDPYIAYNYARLLDYMRRYREAYSVYKSLKEKNIDPKIKKLVEERFRILSMMGFGE